MFQLIQLGMNVVEVLYKGGVHLAHQHSLSQAREIASNPSAYSAVEIRQATVLLEEERIRQVAIEKQRRKDERNGKIIWWCFKWSIPIIVIASLFIGLLRSE